MAVVRWVVDFVAVDAGRVAAFVAVLPVALAAVLPAAFVALLVAVGSAALSAVLVIDSEAQQLVITSGIPCRRLLQILCAALCTVLRESGQKFQKFEKGV